MTESSESSEGKFLSLKEFLATCSSEFKYNYAGASYGPMGDELRGRGRFHTKLDEMKKEDGWKGMFKKANNGNVLMYTKKMLKEAKRRVLAESK